MELYINVFFSRNVLYSTELALHNMSLLLPKTAQLFLDLGAGLHGAGGQIAIWLKKVFFPKSPFYTKNV